MVFYLITLLGSSSLGYSLLRAGFPKTQALKTTNKVLYGYIIGLIIILPAMLTAFYFGAGSFFLMLGLIYCLLFAVFIAKRISFGEVDNVELIKEKKKKIAIPKRILTHKDAKENRERNEKTEQLIKKPIITPTRIKEQIFKEKQPNVIAELREKTTKIEEEKKQVAKKDALKKMGSLAKQLNKKKKNNDEINEDELNSMGKGF